MADDTKDDAHPADADDSPVDEAARKRLADWLDRISRPKPPPAPEADTNGGKSFSRLWSGKQGRGAALLEGKANDFFSRCDRDEEGRCLPELRQRGLFDKPAAPPEEPPAKGAPPLRPAPDFTGKTGDEVAAEVMAALAEGRADDRFREALRGWFAQGVMSGVDFRPVAEAARKAGVPVAVNAPVSWLIDGLRQKHIDGLAKTMGARIAAYKEGDAQLKKIAAAGEAHEQARAAYRAAVAEWSDLYNKANEAGDAWLKETTKKRGRDAKKVHELFLARAEAKEKQRVAEEKMQAAAREVDAGQARARQAVIDAAKADRPGRFDLDPASSASDKAKGKFKEGREFVEAVLNMRDGERNGVATVGLISAPGARAFHRPEGAGKSTIMADPEDSPAVSAHELGHAIEEHVAGAGDAALAFLKHRVGGEATVPMNQVAPGRYEPHEMGRKDNFDRHFKDPGYSYYVGKDYGGRASEVVSMGIQALYEDPVGFCKNDPEYAKFVLGVLSGHLRA